MTAPVPTLPPRDPLGLRQSWRQVQRLLWRDIVPEAVSLAMLVLLIGTAIGVTALADRSVEIAVREAEARLGQQVARLAASAARSEPERDEAWLGELAETLRARRIELLDGSGTVLLSGVGRDGATRGAGLAEHDRHVVAASNPGVDGFAAVRVELPRFETQGLHPALMAGGLAATAIPVLCFALIHRRLRAHVRPFAAIQRNLEDYAQGVERELTALALSDSLGPPAKAWNQLLAQLAELAEHASNPARSGGAPAGAALQRFEGRALRRLLDRLPLGLMRVNASEHVTYANATAQRHLGASESPVGRTLTSLIGEAGARALALGGPKATFEFSRPLGSDASAGVATLRIGSMPDEDCAPGEALLSVEDVSNEREAERSRDTFLYHVTHELRTPLTNIHAYAETLSRPDFDDEQTRKECYNVIISETRRLATLVEDILNVSQLEGGAVRMEIDDVDIARLLRGMVQDSLAAADNKKVDLALHLPPKIPPLRGDKQRLAMLVSNLIGNAVKYTPSGGRVDVSLETTDDAARILVRDTGIGIPPAEQPRVFESFYRATNATIANVPGTGLGLAIAREVARLHGGDVWLSSKPGEGSTFVAEIPLAAAAKIGGATR